MRRKGEKEDEKMKRRGRECGESSWTEKFGTLGERDSL